MASSFVYSRAMVCGISKQMAVMARAATKTSCILMRITFRILSVSLRPQYWAMSTPPPDDRPKPMDIKMEKGWPPTLAALMATSPKLPSITLSIRFTPKLIIFCKAMGTEIASSEAKKRRSKMK